MKQKTAREIIEEIRKIIEENGFNLEQLVISKTEDIEEGHGTERGNR